MKRVDLVKIKINKSAESCFEPCNARKSGEGTFWVCGCTECRINRKVQQMKEYSNY